MSLSKTIIYGTDADVKQQLSFAVPLDQIDEYGYTPLVQAAIVNSLSKAKLLLQAGASVDFTDLTGRTALHWASDNNNLELAKLLLEKKANANAYTRAGQPVLVFPHLREQFPLKQILYQYEGSLDFARDFINAKSLGHRFQLEGRVDIVTPKNLFIEVEFEGFYLEFSLAMLANSLRDFIRNYGGKHLRDAFPFLQMIIRALQNASDLLKYQHYLIKVKEHEDEINQLLKHHPLIIPIAFTGHAITFIRYKQWLIRCDRGEFGAEHGTVIFYRVGKPLLFNADFIRRLLYKRQDKGFINQGIIDYLELKPAMTLPLPTQLTGNCSWANVEAVVPTLLFALSVQENAAGKVIDMAEAKRDALNFYQEWLAWDQQRELSFCLNSFFEANPARKATKAAILAAILFQRTDYHVESDITQAKKILRAFQEPDYHYILSAYLKVFEQDKKNKNIKDFAAFLDDNGIDTQKLRLEG